LPLLSPADTVLTTALFMTRDWFGPGVARLAEDLERAYQLWYRGRPAELIAHARRRGLLRVLRAACEHGRRERGAALAELLEPLRRITPPRSAAWPELLPRLQQASPRRRVLALLEFPDRRIERLQVAVSIGLFGFSATVLRRFLRDRAGAPG
jgi:hypothetical protein